MTPTPRPPVPPVRAVVRALLLVLRSTAGFVVAARGADDRGVPVLLRGR